MSDHGNKKGHNLNPESTGTFQDAFNRKMKRESDAEAEARKKREGK